MINTPPSNINKSVKNVISGNQKLVEKINNNNRITHNHIHNNIINTNIINTHPSHLIS